MASKPPWSDRGRSRGRTLFLLVGIPAALAIASFIAFTYVPYTDSLNDTDTPEALDGVDAQGISTTAGQDEDLTAGTEPRDVPVPDAATANDAGPDRP